MVRKLKAAAARNSPDEAEMPAGTVPATRKSTMPTLQDVATKAGVSLMSISLVVNGRAGRLGDDTRERIEAAITALNYRPNVVARSLRMSRGISVGMVIVDAAPQFLSAPFTTQIVAGLSNRLSERGYPLTLQGLPPGQVERALALCHAGIDGLCILMGGAEGERRGILANIASLGVPVVLIQENLSPSQSDCCKIRQDDHGGGVMLAQHLVEAGARRMVMLVPEQSWSSMTERCRGITDVVKAHGTCALTAVDCGDESVAATRAALGRYLDVNGTPDAVVGGNDRMATAALLEMRTRKIDVPSQVMVTGFNGFSPRDVVEPLLTTVASPAYEIGIGAANAMLDRLATGAFAEPDILLPVQFLPGDSTRPIAL